MNSIPTFRSLPSSKRVGTHQQQEHLVNRHTRFPLDQAHPIVQRQHQIIDPRIVLAKFVQMLHLLSTLDPVGNQILLQVVLARLM